MNYLIGLFPIYGLTILKREDVQSGKPLLTAIIIIAQSAYLALATQLI